jgi:hypothetical protein
MHLIIRFYCRAMLCCRRFARAPRNRCWNAARTHCLFWRLPSSRVAMDAQWTEMRRRKLANLPLQLCKVLVLFLAHEPPVTVNHHLLLWVVITNYHVFALSLPFWLAVNVGTWILDIRNLEFRWISQLQTYCFWRLLLVRNQRVGAWKARQCACLGHRLYMRQ